MSVSIERILDLADRSARKAVRNNYSILDDVRQEGAINGWKALQRKPDASEAYIQTAIINGIHDYFHGYITGGGVGVGKGDSKYRPELETELSELTEKFFLGKSDEYPSLAETNTLMVDAINSLKDPIKAELMCRKYIYGQEDSDIREAMGLSINEANIHHRWAKVALRKALFPDKSEDHNKHNSE